MAVGLKLAATILQSELQQLAHLLLVDLLEKLGSGKT